MGQSPVCSFCSDQEKEQNLKDKNKNILIIENKDASIMDRPILKENKISNSLNISYIGGYTTSSMDGFNILRWSNNSEFKGIFQNGIPNGWGIFTHPNNGIYQGEYEDDNPNGYGIYKHITDSIYEGEWVNEKQEGYGIEEWKDGAIYKGEFNQGKKNGIGIYIFPNKNIYLGEWSQNLMNGYGIYSYGKNQLYMGQWVNGLRNGYGEIYGPKNDYFVGFFKNNLKHGFFMFYNIKTRKIIIGFNKYGKIDGILKCFRGNQEEKLIIVKNGRKIKEMDNEEKINNYLNEPDNFDSNQAFMEDRSFNEYFLMKRNELEDILIQKYNSEDIDQINERLGKKGKDNNIKSSDE